MSTRLPPNLNPNVYTIEQLYSFFNLTPETATEASLKEAKRKVLALHPDRAGPQYQQHFVFYMASFNRVTDHHEIFNREATSQKKMQQGRETGFHYQAPDAARMAPDTFVHHVQKTGKIGEFNQQFNEAYDQYVKKPVDHSQYHWFGQETPVYSTGKVASAANIANEIDAVRRQQEQYQVSVYRGVQQLNAGSVGGHGLYDDDETVRGSTYVSSDPFSKLKYDDLRKVHKDETVFTVSEKQYSNMPKYRNVEEYAAKARPDDYSNIPLTRQQIEEQQRAAQYAMAKEQRMKQMERDAYNNASKYDELNNKFMANLLRLKEK